MNEPKSHGLWFAVTIHISLMDTRCAYPQWQIFRTSPDAALPEPTCLSASPPNAPPRQSKRQGQRTKRPVAVYNLCLELEDGKMWMSPTLGAGPNVSVSVFLFLSPLSCNVLD